MRFNTMIQLSWTSGHLGGIKPGRFSFEQISAVQSGRCRAGPPRIHGVQTSAIHRRHPFAAPDTVLQARNVSPASIDLDLCRRRTITDIGGQASKTRAKPGSLPTSGSQQIGRPIKERKAIYSPFAPAAAPPVISAIRKKPPGSFLEKKDRLTLFPYSVNDPSFETICRGRRRKTISLFGCPGLGCFRVLASTARSKSPSLKKGCE